MTDRVTVMIVDDQAPVPARRRGPCVDRIAGFELVAEVDVRRGAVAPAPSYAPDLVLMDINMGELDGIEATRLITAAAPPPGDPRVDLHLDDLPPTAWTSGAAALRQQGRAVATVVRRLWEEGGDPALATATAWRRRRCCRCRSASGQRQRTA